MSERKLLHGGDYNPEQWLDRPDILEQDITMMKQAHVNVVTLGVFSWSVMEPREGEYHFDWLEAIIHTLYANGISTILATPSAARPAWMAQKYPEVRRVRADRTRELFRRRQNYCYTSPLFRQKVRAIDEQLARRFGEELVREAGTRALIGRSIEDRSKKGKNETSVKRHYSAPEAYNAFLSRIAVIYGKGGTA